MNASLTFPTIPMRTSLAYPLRLLSVALVALALVGCDSNDDDDGLGGDTDGTATVQGADIPAISGNAYAVLDSDNEFAIAIFNGSFQQIGTTTDAWVVLATDDPTGVPPNGTYAIGDDGDGADFEGGYLKFNAANPQAFSSASVEAESGTLTITSSSNDAVRGTYRFTGTLVEVEGSTQTTTPGVTISGSFDAEVLRNTDIPDDF